MPSKNIQELKALLAERFPSVRTYLEEPRTTPAPAYPTGLPQIDAPLGGGLPKGALSEIVVSAQSCGSSTLIRALLVHAAFARRIAVYIDGRDSFNATHVDETTLSHLLWIRCHTASEAMRAGDLVLRDNNLPLVFLDLKANPETELRKISPASWYRFQRLVEETGTVCLVLTPRRLVTPARALIRLHSQFSIVDLEQDPKELLSKLVMEVRKAGHYAETEFAEFKA